MSAAQLGPTLSLLVPCYNEASHLRQSVATLLHTLDGLELAYEVIFVDDASADDTVAILRELCAAHAHCRLIACARNGGRGAAVKRGFAEARGEVVGFLDIDLEIGAHYIPLLVDRIRDGADVAVARRTNELSSPRAVLRAAVSRAYQAIQQLALGLDVRGTGSGCKFFRRATAAGVVLGSEHDGWFWDTEVVARAQLGGLRVDEVPVLFRRSSKPSTVRLLPDAYRQLLGLHRFRERIGMGLTHLSPVYWSTAGYDRAMDLLYGGYRASLDEVARLVPDGAELLDLCCGTCRLATRLGPRCRYVGLDRNGRFVRAARRRGIDARLADVRTQPLPEADWVVCCSSLYHFHAEADALLGRMMAAARAGVIVSEPVTQLGGRLLPGSWRARLTAAGGGDAGYRYDLASFTALAEANGALRITHRAGQRNAVAVFPGRALDDRAAVAARPPSLTMRARSSR